MKEIISKEAMIEIIREALTEFYNSKNNEYELIEREISEWAIAFRFGVYLNSIVEKELKGYILDAEFNKYFEKQKEMFLECSENCSGCCLVNRDKDKNKLKGRPDFIIHKRKDGGHLCCIEIKKSENINIKHDKEKLTYMTCPQGNYNYKYGIFLIFHKNKSAKIELYSEGKFITEDYFYYLH